MAFQLTFTVISFLSLLCSLFFADTFIVLFTLVFLVLYNGYGISVGYHRLLSHNSFETHKWIKNALLYLGCQSAQGTPVTWTLTHNRSHHKYTDTELDVHTPTKGFWHAFIGWIFKEENHESSFKDLLKVRKNMDSFAFWCHKNYATIVTANWALLSLIDPKLGVASLNASIIGLFISGLVNTIGHLPVKGLTYETFPLNNKSTNNPWLAFLTWGESLHNNHHAHPKRLSFSTKWYEIDVGYLMTIPIRSRRK